MWIVLSQKTITNRIEGINNNLIFQLKNRFAHSKFCSLTMDESTDVNYTTQLVFFVRGMDDNFWINEELASLKSIKSTTTGLDIYQ